MFRFLTRNGKAIGIHVDPRPKKLVKDAIHSAEEIGAHLAEHNLTPADVVLGLANLWPDLGITFNKPEPAPE